MRDFMLADPHVLVRGSPKIPTCVGLIKIATGSPLLYIVGPNIVKLTLDHRGLISRALDEWAEPEAGM